MTKIIDKIIGLISSIGLISLIGLIVVSCSDDNLANPGTGTGETAIAFQVGTAATTRATGLENFVKDIRVYGTKGTVEAEKPSTDDDRVFDNYVLWYDQTDKGLTSTNTNEWEYVGSYVGSLADETMSTFTDAQKTAITTQRAKYWDHGASHYYFWAIAKANQWTSTSAKGSTAASGSAILDDYGRIASYSKTISSYTDLADATNIVYYTDPIYVPRDGTDDEDNLGSYGKVVNLVFKRVMSRVRFGFYSEVSGWKVTSIHFYKDDSTVATDNTLYINGDIVTSATANITYGYTTPKSPTATYTVSEATTEASFSGFGTLSFDNSLSTNSSAPTYDSKSYVAMIPTGTRADALTLKCDYTLSSDDSDETITIKGASVTISAADCSWQPNNAYTYIFKLTKGTLKPITLDALYTVSETSGTTTTIEDATKPTITTYQVGSVTDDGITYKTGTAIDVTVMYDGTNKTQAADLSDATLTIKYKATADGTESAVTGITYTDAKKATFTPSAAGFYTVTYIYKDADSNDATVQKVITVGN